MPDTKQQPDSVLLMVLSAVGGGLAGFAIWMTTGAFVFFPVFLAVGLIGGIMMAEARKQP